ncbi:MAG: YbbR-like domain-containing protein [Phocaeicola sp.]
MTEKIRISLNNKNGREILIFIFFLFVSFSFWLLQTLNDTYETELSIPLRLQGVPDNVVITEELPHEVKLVVSDKGTVLVNYLLGNKLYPVSIDFTEASDESGSVFISSTSLIRRFSSELNQKTKINSILPDSLGYVYARGEARLLPIKVRGEFLTDRQYYISSMNSAPDSVLVYAPKAILDTLEAVYTRSERRENISDSIHIVTSLQPIKGVRFGNTSCEISLGVDIYAEKTMEIPVRGLNFPSNKMLRTVPSKVQVTFQVGLKQFTSLSEDDFFIGVKYEDLLMNKTGKCRVRLQSAPNSAVNLRVSPTEIDFLIEPRTIQYKYD